VGEELRTDLFFISHDSANKDDFLKAIKIVKQESSKGIVLDCSDKDTLKNGIELLKDELPAALVRNEITDDDIELAKDYGVSLILTAQSFEDLEGQVEKARSAGLNNLILNLESQSIRHHLQNNTLLRRSALKRSFKPFGYPLFSYINAENEMDVLARASVLLCKYDSIIVLPHADKAMLYSLLTLRQNIYTDPQKPIQVDPKVYPIGEPTPESPVFVTTNFSLTYFIVSGEIENSGISAHLVVTDAEGQSVLTAWAAGKFVGEKVAKFIKDIELEKQVKTRKIVIPGFVSQISGDLEEHLPGWEVIVGCQEASDIPSFVKNVKLT
jgi:acetyl-CoA decarbonylase/synthase complex subunit gamma